LFISVVLAAGMSTRFPGNKLLYLWEDKPIVYWTVHSALASSVDRVIVVTGHDRDLVIRALSDLSGRFEEVYNPSYARGMSTSVERGVEYVYEKYGSRTRAIIFTPGDCAWIPPEAYNMLIETYIEKKPPIVVAAYQGIRGHPILFSSALFPELLEVSEETMGLKRVVKKYWWSTVVVNTPYPGVILDIDTYGDLNRVKYLLKK